MPSCSKCNQSNGNKDWKTWMLGNAALSPASRRIAGTDQRTKRLEAYAEWGSTAQIDFDQLVDPESWEQHWRNWNRILAEMRAAQAIADSIRSQIAQAYRSFENSAI